MRRVQKPKMAKETVKEKSETVQPLKEARAVVKYLRISPRKVRLVTQTIIRKPVTNARSILMALNKKAARLVEKALKSAVANAKGKSMEESRLFVLQAKADEGPLMKRFMSRSMGRADRILKRTTHLTLILREAGKTFASPAGPEAGKAKAKQAKPKKVKAAAGKA